MKLHISFDLTNLADALAIAKTVAPFGDILEVGTLLLYSEGVKAVSAFKKEFPDKKIFVDTKISDRAEEVVSLFCKSGADIISVLAGTSNETITAATQAAHQCNVKIALDLIDAYSMGQSARDAETLDVDQILFHRSHEDGHVSAILDEWDNVRGNSKLPIYASGRIQRGNIEKLLPLKPQGVIIGRAIVNAKDPAAEAQFFYELLTNKKS